MAQPQPQPSDLENPVPNQNTNPFDSVDLGGGGSQSAGAPSPLKGNPFEGMDLPPTNDQFDPSAPSAGNVGQTVAPPTSASSPLNQDPNIDPGLNPTYNRSYKPSDMIKNIKELSSVATAYLDEKPSEMLKVAKAFYGDSNAVLKNDKIWFKDEGDKKFRPMTKEDIGSVSHAAAASYQLSGGHSADGLPNFLARMSGNAVNMAGAVGAGAVLNTAAPGIGTLASATLSGAAGSALQASSAHAAKFMLGIPQNSPDAAKDILDKAGQGATGGLLFGSLGLGVSKVGQGIAAGAEMMGSSNRLTKALGLQKAILDVGRDSGMTFHPPAEQGRSLFGGKDLMNVEHDGAVQELKGKLGKELGAVVDTAHEYSGGEKFKIDDTLDQMKDLLSKRGYTFEEGELPHPSNFSEINYEDLMRDGLPDGKTVPVAEMASHPDIKIPPKGSDIQGLDKKVLGLEAKQQQATTRIQNLSSSSDQSAIDAAHEDLDSISSALEDARGQAKDMASENPYPNKEAGSAAHRQLADLYNTLRLKNKYDGFSVKELADAASAIGKIPEFDAEVSRNPNTNSVLQQISGMVSEKKNGVIQQVLEGKDPELAKWAKNTNDRYKEQIDTVNGMLEAFDKTGSAETAGEQLIPANAKNPEKIMAMRQVFGDDSPQWKSIRGNWFLKVLNDHSPNGILDAQGMAKTLNGYSKESLAQLLPGDSQAAVRSSLLRLSKIPATDLTNNPKGMDGMVSGIKYLMGGSLMAHATSAKIAATLFNMAKNNGPLAEHLAGDGMLVLAKDAVDSASKSKLLQAGTVFKNFLANSIRTGDEKVGYTYQPKPELIQFMNSLWQQNADSESGMESSGPGYSTNIRTLGNTFR